MTERYFPNYHVVEGFPMRARGGIELRFELDDYRDCTRARAECKECPVNKNNHPPNVHCGIVHAYETTAGAVIFFNDSQSARDFLCDHSRCGIKEEMISSVNERMRDF